MTTTTDTAPESPTAKLTDAELAALLATLRAEERRRTAAAQPEPTPALTQPWQPESDHAWAARQGGNPVKVGSTLLFPSGARQDTAGGRLQPPSNLGDRLTLRAKYWRLRGVQVENHLNALRAAMDGGPQWTWPTSTYGPPPPDRAGDAHGTAPARFLANLLNTARAELAAVESELADTRCRVR